MPATDRPAPGLPGARAPLRAADLALVFVGGALGALARAGVGTTLPAGTWPWGTLAVNLTGVALLAALVAVVPSARRVRILVGTGVLGAFTTYSALAVEVVDLRGAPGSAVGYASATVLGGLGIAIAVDRLIRRSRR
jgi:fluoride exporter